jgi:RNA polymerase sigma-70 factor (ECF subfamily)
VIDGALEQEIRAACIAGSWAEAATRAIERYGPEVLSYLRSLARDELDAGDAFAIFCEELWRSLPRFRWESSARTWTYALARNTWLHVLRDPARRAERRVALTDAASRELAERVRTSTPVYQRTDTKDRLAAIRAELEPDDRTLLVLRIDRELPWEEIARVLAAEGEELDDDALARRSLALRKRFMRLKKLLRVKLRGE